MHSHEGGPPGTSSYKFTGEDEQPLHRPPDTGLCQEDSPAITGHARQLCLFTHGHRGDHVSVSGVRWRSPKTPPKSGQ